MQIVFLKPFDKRATTLLLCFSGFATTPKFFAHLACDIPACNVALCYGYSDIHLLDSSVDSRASVDSNGGELPAVLRDLQALIDGHRCCILVAFSLGVSVASRLMGRIDRAGAFRLCIAINGTPLGIDARYGIHPRIYARTLGHFTTREFARAFYGSTSAQELESSFGSEEACKEELLALQKFCLEVPLQALHFTHAIISSKDRVFPPAVVESTFLQAGTKCHHIDAPHYIFDRFASWLELLRVCVPSVELSGGERFWEVRLSYASNAPVQATMRHTLIRLLLAHTGRREFARVFEFGAGAGEFSAALQENLSYKHFVCNDINNHLGALQARLSAHTQVAIFDMRDIKSQPLFRERFDLIASNACLQWLRAEEVLVDVANMLADDGVLLLGSFGEKNCYEIREICGIGLEYSTLGFLCELLERLGLEILYRGSEEICLDCGSALGVFRHFRASGVALRTPKYALSKSTLLAYEKRFGGRITYEPMYIVARKRA